MIERGQGAFEYILMLSGVLLIVILIIFILQGTLSGTNNTLGAQQNTYNASVSADIVPQYTQCLIITTATGNVNGPSYPCCMLNGAANLLACTTSPAGCNTVTGIVQCTQTTLTCPTTKFHRKAGRCA